MVSQPLSFARIYPFTLSVMIRKANCKINLGLDVLRRREDGYHDIETVMYPVHELYDVIEVERSSEDHFSPRGLAIDCPDDQNLCLRAIRLMQERYGTGSVSVVLDKRIPFGAGLGGGSSDATGVIMALADLFELRLSEEELIDCAATLGSDTAFFVRNTPQMCTGRGNEIPPVEVDLRGWWIAILKPACGVSTAEAYAGITPSVPAEPLAVRIQQPVTEWQKSLHNAFEPHICAMHPEIAEAKRKLLDYGAVYAAMSGSGSAVFGIFEEAQIEKVQSEHLTPFIFPL